MYIVEIRVPMKDQESRIKMKDLKRNQIKQKNERSRRCSELNDKKYRWTDNGWNDIV